MTCFDHNKLKGKIREVYGTQVEFAKTIGISSASLNKKLNNKVEFTQKEISQAVISLELDNNEIPVYFFTQKV